MRTSSMLTNVCGCRCRRIFERYFTTPTPKLALVSRSAATKSYSTRYIFHQSFLFAYAMVYAMRIVYGEAVRYYCAYTSDL